MRIGVMLRALEEKQGIGIYSLNLMDELLPLDPQTDYVLFYKNPAFLGRYAAFPNVTEKLVTAPGKFAWDQIRLPLEARRAGVDVLFHTKFTVPFCTGRKTVMTVHGASWFVHPELYTRADIAYIRAVMPLYCRKADLIIANSDLTRDDFIRILKVPPEKIRTIRLGTSRSFKVVSDAAALAAIRTKYTLPARFILSVIKYDPRKNFKNLIAGFRLLRQRMPGCKLVVAGIGCDKYISEYRLAADGTLDDMTFLGWVDQAELPLLYTLADCMLFPSVYEEFGIPTCEAMACGCPVVVSKTGALPEIAGDAGEIVDPFDPESIAAGLQRVLSDDARRAGMRERGLARAGLFTWRRCAAETREALHELR
jgi:glycosyltransferase involved in cell wall biosynthesis